MQQYAREQDFVTKFSVENLPHERQTDEYSLNAEKESRRDKRMWSPQGHRSLSLSLRDLRPVSMRSLLGKKKVKNMIEALNLHK